MQQCYQSPSAAGLQQQRCAHHLPLPARIPVLPRSAKQHRPNKSTVTRSAPADAAAAGDNSRQQGFKLPKFKLLPDQSAWQLVRDSFGLVYSNIWAIVIIFAFKDAAAFLLHRVAHRLTNHFAESLFGLPISTLGNPWWIMVDAKYVEGHISYQILVGIFFLLCLPLNILFNTAAVSTAAVVCTTARPSAKPHAVPSATYTGQGRGKVGLAECRSTSSLDDGQCIAAWSELDSSTAPAGAAAAGVASFQRVGCVTFRQQGGTAATSKAESSSSSIGSIQAEQACSSTVVQTADNKQQSQKQKQQKQQAPQPAAAPALPWLAPAQQRPKLPNPPGLKASLAMVQEAWSKQVSGRLRQLWTVDILFNVWALPLQALCLAVLPVFWAFPRLLEIQLALPAAVLAGAKGKDALDKSRDLMKDFKSSYAWPFVWLIVLGRAVEVLREFVLISMPPRWWTDVIEVPLAATAFFAVARLLLLRVQDLVPLAAYLFLQRERRVAAAAAAL